MSKYKKGSIVVETSGAYSDYSFHGIYRVMTDFDIKEQFKLWANDQDLIISDDGGVAEMWCDVNEKYTNEFKVGFFPWMAKAELISSINYSTVHTGEYGETRIR